MASKRCGLAHGIVNDEFGVIKGLRNFLDRVLAVSGTTYSATKLRLLNALDASFEQSHFLESIK